MSVWDDEGDEGLSPSATFLKMQYMALYLFFSMDTINSYISDFDAALSLYCKVLFLEHFSPSVYICSPSASFFILQCMS